MRNRGLALLGTVLLVAGCGSHEAKSAANAKTFTMHGTLALQGHGNWGSEPPECTGAHDYSNLEQGTQVVVTNAADRTVALGTMSDGTIDVDDCDFKLTVPHMPNKHGFYTIRIGLHTTDQYTLDEMKAGPQLSIGP